MSDLVIPQNYSPVLSVKETEHAIVMIKDFFQLALSTELNLTRVTAPLFVPQGTGLNDDLNGVERAVSFPVKDMDDAPMEIVHSLAKWKRVKVTDLRLGAGFGIYTDMNAIRRDEDTDNIARRGFQEQEEGPHLGNVRPVFAQHIGIGDYPLIVGIGRGAVGDKARLALRRRGQAADLMRHRFPIVFGAPRLVGNDVALLQRGRIDLLHQHQIPGGKVCFTHRIGQHDKCLIAKQAAVPAVKGGNRNDGKNHHKDRHRHDEPYQNIFNYIQCLFHICTPNGWFASLSQTAFADYSLSAPHRHTG